MNRIVQLSFQVILVGFMILLKKTIHYPKSALVERRKLKVGVQMNVNENGAITNIITPADLRKDFEEEIHRIIALMPR